MRMCVCVCVTVCVCVHLYRTRRMMKWKITGTFMHHRNVHPILKIQAQNMVQETAHLYKLYTIQQLRRNLSTHHRVSLLHTAQAYYNYNWNVQYVISVKSPITSVACLEI